MVMNHYQRPSASTCARSSGTRPSRATQVYPTTVGDCRHRTTAWPTTCRAAARRVDVRRPLDVDGAVQRADPRRRLPPPRRRDAPDARQPDLRPDAARRARPTTAPNDHPYNTIRPILHEPGPIANGTFTIAAGHPGRRGRGARARRGTTTTRAARRGDGLLGAAAGARRHASTGCAPMPADVQEVTGPRSYDRRGALRLRPRGAAAEEASGRGGRSAASRRPIGDQYFCRRG